MRVVCIVRNIGVSESLQNTEIACVLLYLLFGKINICTFVVSNNCLIMSNGGEAMQNVVK